MKYIRDISEDKLTWAERRILVDHFIDSWSEGSFCDGHCEDAPSEKARTSTKERYLEASMKEASEDKLFILYASLVGIDPKEFLDELKVSLEDIMGLTT